MLRRSALALLCLLVLACESEAPVDAAAVDGGFDAGFDAFVRPPRTVEELPAPTQLMAGMAEARIPAPLGIGTMGFGPFGVDRSVTPFAEQFPGTTRLHGQLTLRAVALSRGERHEVIFVRMDTVGVFQQARSAVLDELQDRLGRDLSDSLILAGNHTHSGPGRLLMTDGALVALGDTFLPEYYDNFIGSIADVVEEALADLAPAELGVIIAQSSEGHQDRRCENDALAQLQESPDLPLIAIRRGGQLDAVVASYGYHGTVLGIDDLTLSGDMGSVVEQKIEERMDHPVMVLFFNSWGADMAPGNPAPGPSESGADQPGGFDRMDRVGNVIADALLPRLDEVVYSSDVPVRARTYRVPLTLEAIGYEEDEFDYPYGGAFCGIGRDGNCEDDAPVAGLTATCLRITPREELPRQTLLTAGVVGELTFVTAPGEWSTALGNGVLDRMRDDGVSSAMLIGYANDYTGYALSEADWYQGGYEASGGLWGPRQGDYLAARLYDVYESFRDLYDEPPWLEPARVEPFGGYTYDDYVPETPIGIGTITADVPSSPAATDAVTFTVLGADPWLGNPVATLEVDEGGGAFVPVTRSNGRVVSSESYDFWVDLVTEPTYEASLRTDREFRWTFHFPITRRAASSIPALSGAHRFSVAIPTASGAPMVVRTSAFSVSAP